MAVASPSAPGDVTPPGTNCDRHMLAGRAAFDSLGSTYLAGWRRQRHPPPRIGDPPCGVPRCGGGRRNAAEAAGAIVWDHLDNLDTYSNWLYCPQSWVVIKLYTGN